MGRGEGFAPLPDVVTHIWSIGKSSSSLALEPWRNFKWGNFFVPAPESMTSGARSTVPLRNTEIEQQVVERH
jgi:hypothetical protein